MSISILILLCTACGSMATHGRAPSVVVMPAPMQTLSQQQIQAARDELAKAEAPYGTDPAQFAQLRSALDTMLAARLESRSVSKLPNQQKNTVADAEVVDAGGGAFNLTWTYRNVGDYGQNGEVGIADLTPLGSNLGKTSSGPGWDKAQVADGDGNGAITVADITPIGANLGAQVSGYKIYGGNSADGPWGVLLGSVLIADATGTPKSFSFPLGTTPPPFILLSAFDAAGDDWQGGVDPVPAQVTLGSDVPDQNATVIAGNAGTLTGSAGTPLEGYSITIPATSFDIDTQVSLGYNDGTVTPNEGTQLGPIIELTTDYGQPFKDPVEITVPYSGAADDLPIPFYIEPTGGLRMCDITDLDPAAQTMTFNTWHASSFAVILAKLNNLGAPDYDTKFDPADNGFQVPNDGSKYNLIGECLGMSAYAEWYFRHKPDKLFKNFMSPVGTSGLKGQDIIATRAYNSINRGWDVYYALQRWQWTELSNEQQWLLMRYALVNTADPCLISLRDPDTQKSHSVLAYAYVGDDIFIYDPNYPGETRKIHYREQTKALESYEDYTQFAAAGDGSLAINEDFENIAEDAEQNFAGVADAEVNFDPGDDSEIPMHQATLNVSVNSGQILVDKLKLVYGPNGQYSSEANVDLEGDAQITVNVVEGDNYYRVFTSGKSARGSEINVPNDYRDKPGFHLIGHYVQPYFHIDLTWDTGAGALAGDLDLAVQLNSDWVSGAAGHTQGDGDLLSAFVTPALSGSGGPEVFSIQNAADVVKGNYVFRVHKVDDPFDYTPYTINVYQDGLLTDQQTGYVSSGDSNPANCDPNGPLSTGEDWGTIFTYGIF